MPKRLHELLPAGARIVKKTPKRWLDWALTEYPKQLDEGSTAYIHRLHGLMREADNVTNVWEYPTFRARYYNAVRPPSDQKTRGSSLSKLHNPASNSD